MDKNELNKIYQSINFIEELSWLIDGKKNISLKELSFLLREIVENNSPYTNNKVNKKNVSRPNKHFLIGVLPELFQDSELFKSTSELLDFAESVLEIKPISRASKRSRMEYIGYIICEITYLKESQLKNLVNALENIVGNDIKLRQMKDAKKQPNFSWNETILKLSK